MERVGVQVELGGELRGGPLAVPDRVDHPDLHQAAGDARAEERDRVLVGEDLRRDDRVRDRVEPPAKREPGPDHAPGRGRFEPDRFRRAQRGEASHPCAEPILGIVDES